MLSGSPTPTFLSAGSAMVTNGASALNDPPIVAGPIDDLTVDEDSPNTIIELDSVFDAPDFPLGDSLTYHVTVTNSVAGLASQVSTSSYTSLHQDLLYTHAGDNRGTGLQHDLARDNIAGYFGQMGLTTSLEPFQYNSQTYYNVVATKPGSSRPNDVYLVGAHYDSVSNPGADDNASGTAAVMELARVLSQYEFDATLVFAAFDREEQGLKGSYAYVAAHSAQNVLGMVSLDMIAYNPAGTGHNKVKLYDSNNSGGVQAALATAFAEYGGGLTASDAGTLTGSDHHPFEQAGKDAALVIEYELWSNPHYHKATDAVETPGYIDYAYATNITRGVLGYLATAAGLETDSAPLTATVVDGQLTLDYTADAGGIAEVEVRAEDRDGAWVADTFRVKVDPINDRPVLDDSGTPSLATVDEDDTTNNGTRVADLLASAGDPVVDADVGALEGIAVIGADDSHGTWQYSTNGGGTWHSLGTPAPASARLLGADTGTRIRFVPAAHWNGIVDPAITFLAWDHTAGFNGGVEDSSAGGAAAAFSAATETASIRVRAAAGQPIADAGGPYAGVVTIDLELSAAASTDPNDDIVLYEWDLDDDGQFDDASGVTAVFSSSEAGQFPVGVRVTDSLGDWSTDSAQVTIVDAAAADIRPTSVVFDGDANIQVTYRIEGGPVLPFEFGFYRSADTAFGTSDVLAGMAPVSASADRVAGLHSKTFPIGSGAGEIPLPGAGELDIDSDYFLLAVADPQNLISETAVASGETNNSVVISGVYHEAGGPVMVHGTGAGEVIKVLPQTASQGVQVDFRGTLYEYPSSDITGVRIRAHAGNDELEFTVGDGFGSSDTLVFLFHGGSGTNPARLWGSTDTTGKDSASLYATRGIMSGPGYSVNLNSVRGITAYGSGGPDDAYLYDSSLDDTFAAYPTHAVLSNSLYTNRAEGFRNVFAYAQVGGAYAAEGGNDVAHFYGLDGTRDYFRASATYAIAADADSGRGKTYFVRGNWFEEVHAYGRTTNNRPSGADRDQAMLYDAATTDLFEAETATGPAKYMYSGASAVNVHMFRVVKAYGAAGDTGNLYGGAYNPTPNPVMYTPDYTVWANGFNPITWYPDGRPAASRRGAAVVDAALSGFFGSA